MRKNIRKPSIRFRNYNNDWEQRKYEEVVVLSQGLQIPISERYLEDKLDRMLYITNEIFNTRISQRYYIKKPKESVVAKKEDILMTRTGNTGKVVTNIEGAFHNNFFKIDYKEYFDQYFLKYSLTRPATQSEILSRAGSSTIPDISHKDFYSMRVSLPGISEQIKIGELLKNIDKSITLHQRKLNCLESAKTTFLNMMFPKKDANVPEFRFSNLNEKWSKKKLEDIFIKVNERGSNNLDFVTVRYEKTIIRPDAHQGYGNSRDSQTKEKAKIIKKNNFLIDLTSYERGFFMASIDGLTSSAYTVLKNKEKINHNYWREFFTSHNFIESLKEFTPPGARQGKMVEVNEVLGSKFLVPSLTEQEQIGSFFKEMNILITLHQRKLKGLEDIKKYYLKHMFV